MGTPGRGRALLALSLSLLMFTGVFLISSAGVLFRPADVPSGSVKESKRIHLTPEHCVVGL